MISSDQPKIFGNKIIAAVSSIKDGNMKKSNLQDIQLSREVDRNRKDFLSKTNIEPEQTVLVKMSYDRNDFTRFREVDMQDIGKGIVTDDVQIADALCTKTKGVALFLPLADCVGVIIYDPKKEILMVSHLGRHNTEQYSAKLAIEYLSRKFGSTPEHLLVWLSPAADCLSYPLYAFMNKSLQDVNTQQLVEAGIKKENIEICKIDTAISEHYYSHSQFLKGNREDDGRFAIVAMIK